MFAPILKFTALALSAGGRLAARLWALIQTPIGRRVALAVLLILALILARGHWLAAGEARGRAGEQAAERARVLAALKGVAVREQAAAVITDHAAAVLTAERVRVVYRTQILTQEVPVYVTPKSDADCVVPLGFVRLHDAAASGDPASLPGPAGGSLQAASGVPLSAVAATVIGNYGVAYDWRAEALTWRDWYARQKAAWDAPTP